MERRLSAFCLGAIVVTLFSACASQPAGNASSNAAPGSAQKCEVDAKRVCQEVRNQPVVDAQTGQTQDQTEREQNYSRTDSRFVSF
jgi:hypothetical protein